MHHPNPPPGQRNFEVVWSLDVMLFCVDVFFFVWPIGPERCVIPLECIAVSITLFFCTSSYMNLGTTKSGIPIER